MLTAQETAKLRTVLPILGVSERGKGSGIWNHNFCLMIFLNRRGDRMFNWGIYKEKLLRLHTKSPLQELFAHHCYVSDIWDSTKQAPQFKSPHLPSAKSKHLHRKSEPTHAPAASTGAAEHTTFIASQLWEQSSQCKQHR